MVSFVSGFKGNECTCMGCGSVKNVFTFLISYSLRKNICSVGSKLFHFRENPFSEEAWCTGCHKVVPH